MFAAAARGIVLTLHAVWAACGVPDVDNNLGCANHENSLAQFDTKDNGTKVISSVYADCTHYL
jgi:hypothetical protein